MTNRRLPQVLGTWYPKDYLLTSYLLSTLESMEQWEVCLGPALDPGALTSQDLPMWTVQKAETENNPGFLLFHYLLPKTQSNHGLHHPATSHNIHRTGKSREQRKTGGDQAPSGLPGWEWESWDFPPALQPDWELFLPLKVIILIIRWPLGCKTQLSLLHSLKGNFDTVFPQWVTWNDIQDWCSGVCSSSLLIAP